jgi:peptide-methionine (S)-S-oxide reductase
VQIDFDPSVISYEELLHIFWTSHNCTSKSSRQYMSAIFYHDDEQKALAETTKKKRQEVTRAPIATVIQKAETFYDAEE